MERSRGTFIVRVLRTGSSDTAGVGFVADDEGHIVTCAHVVNAALGRDLRAQDRPSGSTRIQVEFPLLGGSRGSPGRSCSVQAWEPPGGSGGDVAGLAVAGEGLPLDAGPATLAGSGEDWGTGAKVFGYPESPPRQDNGAWVGVRVRGAVGGGAVQLDADSDIRTQPGYSGSPVIITGGTGAGEVAGMLAVAARGGAAADSYAVPVAELARSWPDVIGPLIRPTCPYRGLEAFTAEDADMFFGREEDVDRLEPMMRGRALTVVTGASGVGKSSLVNAGLIPRLRRAGWAAAAFRPGTRLVDSLARALAVVEAQGTEPTAAGIDAGIDKWAARIRSDGLDGAGARLALALRRPVLIHVDQLEEVLDPGSDPRQREQEREFLRLLLSAHAGQNEGLHVVATLRADFCGQLLDYPDAGPRLDGGWFGLSPMGEDRLEHVITRPAGKQGVRYQDRVAARIARDAGDGRGLPLLEFALTQLWPLQRDREIGLDAYEKIGRVAGALAAHADRVCRELSGQYTDRRVRRVLLALVRSRGGAADAIRRAVSRDQLSGDWEVVQALARHRLVVIDADTDSGKETSELTHEALIREWPTLVSWVDDDAEFLRWRASIEERDPDDLLPGSRLAEADRWLDERPEDIPGDVRTLVAESKAARHRRVAELEEARERAEDAWRSAEARRLAIAVELDLREGGVPLQVPLNLAIAALETAPVPEADAAIRHAMRLAPRPITRLDCGDGMTMAGFNRDGTGVVFEEGGGSTRVFDAATGAENARLDSTAVRSAVPSSYWTRVAAAGNDGFVKVFDDDEIARLKYDGEVRAMAFSLDGTRAAIVGGDGSARVFDAVPGTQVARLDHSSGVTEVAFSPDGTRVAIGCRDGSAQEFHAAAGAESVRLDHGGAVYTVAFSLDGLRVTTASADCSARVFDAATGTEITRLYQRLWAQAELFSPDGTRVVSVGEDDSVRVCDAMSGDEIVRLECGMARMGAFSPDGTRVAVVSMNGSARMFDAVTGTEIAPLGRGGGVRGMVFSPDGTRVATWNGHGSMGVLDAVTGTEIIRQDYGADVTTVAFSPDGSRVAVASNDKRCSGVVDAAVGDEIARLDHGGGMREIVFSPDGSRVASVNTDGRVGVFDAATGAETIRLECGTGVHWAVFSPDGSRIATASADRSARVFDAAAGVEIARLDHGRDVYRVAFSPDGARVVTASEDGSARVWWIDRGQLIEQAKRRLTRNLTQQEWTRYFRDEPYRKTRDDLP